MRRVEGHALLESQGEANGLTYGVGETWGMFKKRSIGGRGLMSQRRCDGLGKTEIKY